MDHQFGFPQKVPQKYICPLFSVIAQIVCCNLERGKIFHIFNQVTFQGPLMSKTQNFPLESKYNSVGNLNKLLIKRLDCPNYLALYIIFIAKTASMKY